MDILCSVAGESRHKSGLYALYTVNVIWLWAVQESRARLLFRRPIPLLYVTRRLAHAQLKQLSRPTRKSGGFIQNKTWEL